MTKEQAKIIYKDVINQFGYVNNPTSVDAVYVLRDGNFLDTCGGFPTHQHINVAKYISQTYNINDINKLNNGSNFMMNAAGAVKITCWNGGMGIKGIYLPKHELAGPQYDAIEEFIARIARNVTEEWPLWIATYDEGQQIEYTKSTYLEERVIADIENYYYSGKLELTESLLTEKIVKMGNKWQVQSEKGRNMGTYNTKAEAEERLRQVHYFKYANEALQEDTRNMLISKSRNAGKYKDQSRGKNRFERKRLSKIAKTVKQYNQINMNKLFKEDLLIVNIPVQGETDQYTVSIKLDGVIAEIAKNIKNNNNKFEYKTVIQALTKVFNTTNVYVKCTCPDHTYNFSHWNIVNNVSVDDTASDPGPGKNIRNPDDNKGRGCKHILLVLANLDWLMKVASVINNYVHYAEEHLQKPFLKIIFPKLYGIPADEVVEQGLVDDDKYLDSSTGLIDAINEYGKVRGRYHAGSNKNPVTGTGGKTKKEEA